VAEEVRNLAMRSAQAAKNTSNLIEQSVNNSRNGVQICGEVKTALDEIVQSIAKTTDLVGEIAAASKEQAQGVDQINTAVSQMDKVTQQSAASAEESASAGEELNHQARALQQIVDELMRLVGIQQASLEHRQAAAAPAASKTCASTGLSDGLFHKIAEPHKDHSRKKRVPASKTSKEIALDKNQFDEFSS
jgi:methyl-accepting chemotaxis protein